ncbi:MAG TPA: hypothetical protein VIK29_10850 [Paludibacter sp.]
MNQADKQNESALSSKSNIKDKRADKSSHFELPPVTGLPPEGFMTGEEFWAGVKSDLKKYYQENGLL